MNVPTRPITTFRPTASKPVARIRSQAEVWGLAFIALACVCWAASFVVGFQLALTVLTLAGLAAALVGLRQPIIGLFGVGVLCTLDPIASALLLTGGLLRWNTLNYWLLIVIVLSLPFLLRLNDPQTRIAELFVLLLALETTISSGRDVGAQQVLGIIILFGLLIYFARAGADNQSLYWLALVMGVVAAAGGMAFILQAGRAAFYLHTDVSLSGGIPYINPNVWSLFPLAALFAICMAFPLASDRPRIQIGLLVLAAVNFVCVFLSSSRGSLLIALCCLLFLAMKIPKLSQRAFLVVMGVLLGFLISTQFTNLQEDSLKRLDLLFSSSGQIGYRTSGRSDLALGGWYIFLDHPFGVGTGGFERAWADLGMVDGISGTYGRGEEKAAHSGWIRTLAENGVPGIVLLSAYVLSFAVVGWQKRKEGLFGLGLLVTSALAVAFLSNEFQDKALWFLCAGVTFLLHRDDILAKLPGQSRASPVTREAQLRET